jgi:undecaprenyl-diphosphatase
VRQDWLNPLVELYTHLGDAGMLWIVLSLVFLCFKPTRKAGIAGLAALAIGFLCTNVVLKHLVGRPRPWLDVAGLVPVIAEHDPNSFPSGHTQSATGNFGCLARWHTHWGFRALCIALLAITAFSRMYLGVHTPLDVGVSLAIGLILVFAFYPVMKKAAEQPKMMYVLLGGMLALSFAFVLYANLTEFPADAGMENVLEGRKNSFSLFGALLGFTIAYPIERKHIAFSEKAPLWGQACKLILGLVGLLAVKEGLKHLFGLCGLDWMWLHAVRYCAVVLFAALIWPLTFPFWSKKR